MNKMMCPRCRQFKNNVEWHFLSNTVCGDCADIGFKALINSSNHTRDHEINNYLKKQGINIKKQ